MVLRGGQLISQPGKCDGPALMVPRAFPAMAQLLPDHEADLPRHWNILGRVPEVVKELECGTFEGHIVKNPLHGVVLDRVLHRTDAVSETCQVEDVAGSIQMEVRSGYQAWRVTASPARGEPACNFEGTRTVL